MYVNVVMNVAKRDPTQVQVVLVQHYYESSSDFRKKIDFLLTCKCDVICGPCRYILKPNIFENGGK